MKRHRFERPRYVTFLCAFLLAGAAVNLFLYFIILPRAQVDFWYQFITNSIPGAFLLSLTGGDFMIRGLDWMAGAEVAISLVCGVFMLMGANWARLLFCIGYMVLCLWSSGCWMMLDSGNMVYIGFRLVVLVCLGVPLTMERANRFFTGRDLFIRGFRDRSREEARKFPSSRYDY